MYTSVQTYLFRTYTQKDPVRFEEVVNVEDFNNYTDLNVGTIGDIYISNRDPLGDFFITEWISKIAWIGHAGVVYNEDATKMVEIVGNDTKENNVVKIYENTKAINILEIFFIFSPF